jgi:hypothetical protein
LQQNGQDSEQLDLLSEIPTASASCAGTGPAFLSGMMLRRLLPTPVVTDSFGARNKTSVRSNPNSKHHDGMTLGDWLRLESESTSSVEASPANLTLLQASVEHLVMSVTSGGNAPGLQANLDLPGASGRTSPACYPPSAATSSPESSVTWPRWGMWSDGQLTALSMWERRTAGIESSSSATMPTPRAEHDSGRHRGKPDTLHSFVKMWPTPTAQTGGDGQRPDGFRRLLGPEVRRREAIMWPTPTTRDHKDGPATSCANVPENGLLGRVVHRDSTATGALTPEFVEWLMGYPIGYTVCEP